MNFQQSTLFLRYIFALGLNFFGIELQGVIIPWLLLRSRRVNESQKIPVAARHMAETTV